LSDAAQRGRLDVPGVDAAIRFSTVVVPGKLLTLEEMRRVAEALDAAIEPEVYGTVFCSFGRSFPLYREQDPELLSKQAVETTARVLDVLELPPC
jgi:hypothetical protein